MLVIVYAPPDVHALELAAVGDVLALADADTRRPPRYEVRLVAESDKPLHISSGRRIIPDATIATSGDPADLLIVCASGSWERAAPQYAIEWLQRQAAGAARFGSIGNGAFLLGAAGLIGGQRITTHWNCSEELARAFPIAVLERDRIFVRDGRLFSSAGGVAAIDLMLSLVEEDHGRDLALKLARHFVLFMKRAGSQAQVSLSLATQATTRDPIQRVQTHVRDNPTADLSVTKLAALAAMSPRNFARVFLHETGMRPTDFVEQSRVNLAMRMLEDGGLSPQQVARLSGFSGTEAARRAFRRRAGTTMSGYRAGLQRRMDA